MKKSGLREGRHGRNLITVFHYVKHHVLPPPPPQETDKRDVLVITGRSSTAQIIEDRKS